MAEKWTMPAIREANREAGLLFFSPSTMRFFGDTLASFRCLGPDLDGTVVFQRVMPMHSHDGKNMGGTGKLYRFDPRTSRIWGIPDGETITIQKEKTHGIV